MQQRPGPWHAREAGLESWKGEGGGRVYNRKGLMCFKLGSDIIESEI